MAETVAGKEMESRAAARKAKADAKVRRVWCAYESDGSNFVLFGQELTAMRYAVEHHMSGCKAVEFGVPLMDQVK